MTSPNVVARVERGITWASLRPADGSWKSSRLIVSDTPTLCPLSLSPIVATRQLQMDISATGKVALARCTRHGAAYGAVEEWLYRGMRPAAFVAQKIKRLVVLARGAVVVAIP